MEPVGVFPDGEWDFFRRMFAGEEHDYSNFALQNHELNNIGTQFCSAPETGENELMFFSLDADHHNSNYSQHNSQENSYSSNCSGDTVLNYFSYPDHVLANNYTCGAASMVFCMDEKKIASFVPSLLADIAMEENVNNLSEHVGSERLENSAYYSHQIQLQLKRKLDVLEPEVPASDKTNNRAENQKKKPRLSKDGQGCMKNSRSKKNLQKLASNGEEAEVTTTGSNGQSSCSSITEDDNASMENSAGAISIVKTRASRGSATDPQSLYARKRREKINERLRILQNLVPNGTKVDISTMLEEAVNYVKFLQVQIKLLSSDDMWMYAPLAYNGLDLGLNLNLNSSPL